MTDTVADPQKAATAKVREIMDRPMAECRDFQSIHDFDPWDIFPEVYGSYDSAFDECAIAVLTDVLDGERRRDDLAADILREMLCTADLCDYGTSPRHCFPSREFKTLLPELIEKWRAYSAQQWSD